MLICNLIVALHTFLFLIRLKSVPVVAMHYPLFINNNESLSNGNFYVCFTDVHFYIGQQVTQNADIIFVTIRLVPVSTRQIQKATAAKMAPTVPLHMGHMICVALFMISGAISIPILFGKNSQTLVLCNCDFDFHCHC